MGNKVFKLKARLVVQGQHIIDYSGHAPFGACDAGAYN
jgi:hypothetical protein